MVDSKGAFPTVILENAFPLFSLGVIQFHFFHGLSPMTLHLPNPHVSSCRHLSPTVVCYDTS